MRAIVLAVIALLAACDEQAPTSAAPPPMPLSRDATGHFCGMVVADHPGPKAQVFLAGEATPYWFTSVRDAKAFTLLPETPKDVVVVYVTDMARAASWEDPGPSWMPATEGTYVIESRRMGGMGHPEAIPFSTAEAAQAFVTENGGRIVEWTAIPQDYVLGGHG